MADDEIYDDCVSSNPVGGIAAKLAMFEKSGGIKFQPGAKPAQTARKPSSKKDPPPPVKTSPPIPVKKALQSPKGALVLPQVGAAEKISNRRPSIDKDRTNPPDGTMNGTTNALTKPSKSTPAKPTPATNKPKPNVPRKPGVKTNNSDASESGVGKLIANLEKRDSDSSIEPDSRTQSPRAEINNNDKTTSQLKESNDNKSTGSSSPHMPSPRSQYPSKAEVGLKSYKLLDLPSNSGKPPQKPAALSGVNLTEIAVEEDDEFYDDIGEETLAKRPLPSAASSEVRPVSTISQIPDMGSDEEEAEDEKAAQTAVKMRNKPLPRPDPESEIYDDVGIEDDEVYEEI